MKKYFLLYFSLMLCFYGLDSQTSTELTYQDLKMTATKIGEKLLQDYQDPKGTKILTISSFENKTGQDLNTDIFLKTLVRTLGKNFKLVKSIGGSGTDKMITTTREKTRTSEEFDQDTVTEKGQLIAPNTSISGSIVKQVLKTGNGALKVDYVISVSLTDLATGVEIWYDDQIITKVSQPTSIKQTTRSQPETSQQSEMIVDPVQPPRKHFFTLGLEGGLGTNGLTSSTSLDDDGDIPLDYTARLKLGYTYEWAKNYGIFLYGFYEFWGKKMQEMVFDHHEYEFQDVTYNLHSLGAGAMLKLSYFYFGGGIMSQVDFEDLDFFLDVGLMFSWKYFGVNLGARYTSATTTFKTLGSTREDRAEFVAGLLFNF